MSKFYSFLIVFTVIAIGGIGVYLLLNKRVDNQLNFNLIQTPTLTNVIMSTSRQNNQTTNSASMDNFITQPDGLKILDEVDGNGPEVKSGDTITVNYIGTLENGTKFDSSYDRNQPFTIQIGVGQVIRGWDEGIIGMKVGGKRKLVIPPSLGYGAQELEGIPSNSTLIFEIELLSVK
jgi:peptidylprolyl isomerase